MPSRIGSSRATPGGLPWGFINQDEVRKASPRLVEPTWEHLEAVVKRGLRVPADSGLCLPRGEEGFECAFVLGELRVQTKDGPQVISGAELGLRGLQRLVIVGKEGRIADDRLAL